MANLPKSVVAFAGNNTKTYEQFKDYYFHFQANNGIKLGEYDASVKFSDKEAKMHTALLAEVSRVGGVNPQGMDMLQFSTHPTLKWAMGAVVNTLIDVNIVAMQIRLALEQISDGKEVDISKLNNIQQEMYNKAVSLSDEIDKERGVGSGR